MVSLVNDPILDLKAELEAKDDMKARLEKTLEMQKAIFTLF